MEIKLKAKIDGSMFFPISDAVGNALLKALQKDAKQRAKDKKSMGWFSADSP